MYISQPRNHHPRQHMEVIARSDVYNTSDRQLLPIGHGPVRATPHRRRVSPYPPMLPIRTSKTLSLQRGSSPSSDADTCAPTEPPSSDPVSEDSDVDSTHHSNDAESSDEDGTTTPSRGNPGRLRASVSMDSSCDGWERHVVADEGQHIHFARNEGQGSEASWEQLKEEQSTDADVSHQTPPSSSRKKIEKPPGECGRPGSGGYNLRDKLGWPQKRYKEVQKVMNSLIDKYLQCDIPMSKQSQARCDVYESEAVEHFPELNDYADFWPVRDFAISRLHYLQCNAARLKRAQELAELRTKKIK
ncbi:hypothetical protein BD626DRAFT_539160 [Schizophyllum amplum]|uniref:Uncharacterized protein n=1 Tax=Schizophyllum amplum TaxID=97359 RepID=A0A550C4R7_9AGAR|nr:hypothetical protein BD626DRAFT_539160 [Auriculariopsis ampla]